MQESSRMNEILVRLARHGLWIVFGNVFLEQVGVPISALPTLIVSGALAADGRIGLLPRDREVVLFCT